MKRFLLLLASVATVATSGCVQTTPHWDSQFGNAVRGAIASQAIDPNAAANRDPVTGIDNAAALGAQQRYEHSFKQPEPRANVTLINTSGK
jgi:hypothetical protein